MCAMFINDQMDDNLQIANIGGSAFNFSAVRLDELQASEYTLVDIEVDVSGSVSSFKKELEDCIKSIIEACKKSPRAENLMIRVQTFGSALDELHGFMLLNMIDSSKYKLIIRGCTALFDASYSGIGACLSYSKTLKNEGIGINAIHFVITDGEDNQSVATPKMIKDMKDKALANEEIESILSILIGVNTSSCQDALDKFKNDAGFDQFISVNDSSASSLAKIANFVSKSISAQSQSLGSGGASKPITW